MGVCSRMAASGGRLWSDRSARGRAPEDSGGAMRKTSKHRGALILPASRNKQSGVPMQDNGHIKRAGHKSEWKAKLATAWPAGIELTDHCCLSCLLSAPRLALDVSGVTQDTTGLNHASTLQ